MVSEVNPGGRNLPQVLLGYILCSCPQPGSSTQPPTLGVIGPISTIFTNRSPFKQTSHQAMNSSMTLRWIPATSPSPPNSNTSQRYPLPQFSTSVPARSISVATVSFPSATITPG